jgi:FkbM family methyltransferase
MRASQPFNRIATVGIRWLLSLLGCKCEFAIKHLHRVGLVETRLPNGQILRLQSNADDWVSNQIFWRGWDGYEPETVPLFFRLAKNSQVTIDVGAYVGFYTLVAAHANPSGRVFAFEPMNQIFLRLSTNIEINNLHNVEQILGAVGGESGKAKFFHVSDSEYPTSSSLSRGFMEGTGATLSATTVNVLSLDDFLQTRTVSRVDLIKIDAESTEPDVLRGAATILERDRPNIVCEVLTHGGNEAALEKLLSPYSYKFYLMTPQGLLPRERIQAHPEFFNYFFTTLDYAEASQL